MQVLKLGSQGQEVKELQLLLVSHGFNLVVDGDFGPTTQKAVKSFQEERSLVSDGVIGPKTWEALEKAHNIEVVHDLDEIEFDSRTTKYLNTLDPKAKRIFIPFIRKAQEVAKSLGYEYLAISGHRGKEEQTKLYNKGRTLPGRIVTYARYGQSNHNVKLALDFGVFKAGKYLDEIKPGEAELVHMQIGKLAKSYGLDWGGLWTAKKRDIPHYEVATGLTMAQKWDKFVKNGSVL